MPRPDLAAVFCALGASVALAAATEADISELTVEVTTDRDFYRLGEPVEVTVTQCNPTPDPITVTYGCPCCHDDYTILDAAGTAVADCASGCVQVVLDITWGPGECRAHTFLWHQTSPFCFTGSAVDPGLYTVLHQWSFSPSFPQAFYLETRSPAFRVGRPSDIPALSVTGSLLFAGLFITAGVGVLRGRWTRTVA